MLTSVYNLLQKEAGLRLGARKSSTVQSEVRITDEDCGKIMEKDFMKDQGPILAYSRYAYTAYLKNLATSINCLVKL